MSQSVSLPRCQSAVLFVRRCVIWSPSIMAVESESKAEFESEKESERIRNRSESTVWVGIGVGVVDVKAYDSETESHD